MTSFAVWHFRYRFRFSFFVFVFVNENQTVLDHVVVMFSLASFVRCVAVSMAVRPIFLVG